MLFIYLASINIISGITFYSDKQKARKKRKRIPEKTLHFMEFAGGVFMILLFMYFIRHKNIKKSYYLVTYFALICWIALLVFLYYIKILEY